MTNIELSTANIPLESTGSISKNTAEKQTLMIVDDYQSNLQAMHALFKSKYKVVLYDNAKDAINYATEDGVDLILLDVDMPIMNGYQACAELKSNSITAHIPIIFVTAANSPDDEEKGLLLGAADYVVKPVNLAILRARVKNHMELVSYRKKLEVLSFVDGLTGLSNRRQLDTMLLQHFASATRFDHSLAVIMIDIDDFKSYNDIYGHVKGDQCLKEVAKTIMSVSGREIDVVGRYGGEEFVVVLPDTGINGALMISDMLLNRMRQLNIAHTGNATHEIVTVSIGVAVFNPQDPVHSIKSVEDLLHNADDQLYKAKRMGKNCSSHSESVNAANDAKQVEK